MLFNETPVGKMFSIGIKFHERVDARTHII